MANVEELMSRIDAEFSVAEKQISAFQNQQVKEYEGRQQRQELFTKACDQLRDTWRPRLEALARKFGEKVEVTPVVTPTLREATFQFRTSLAIVSLKFSVTTDFEVRHLVLNYDLDILPILMKFEPHSRVEFPLESIDAAAVANWIDDRIMDFVKTYLALHQNSYYLKGHMVSDPVSGTQFPKYAAAATLDWQGKTYYFVGETTRREFAQKNGITL